MSSQMSLLPVVQHTSLIHAHISPPRPISSGLLALRSSNEVTDADLRRWKALADLGDLPQNEYYKIPKPVKNPKPVAQRADPNFGKLEIWLDGSLIKVSKPAGNRVQVGGGLRGDVCGFSRASRRRLMQKLAMIEQEATAFFVTLTYPGEYSLDSTQWKVHFDKWAKRLHRRFPLAGFIWRLEPQRRGAPHFHCMVYGIDVSKSELAMWASRSWYECVDSGDERHLRRGVDVRACHNSKGLRGYAGKYLAKVQTPPNQTDVDGVIVAQAVDWTSVGRWWGVRYSKNLPFSKVLGSKTLGYYEAARLMKFLRRYLRGQGVRVSGSMPGMTVFVNSPRQWFANLDSLLIC